MESLISHSIEELECSFRYRAREKESYPLKLRYYQTRCNRSSLHHWFATKPTKDQRLIALPTAAGKTIIFSHFIKEVLAKNLTPGFLLWLIEKNWLPKLKAN